MLTIPQIATTMQTLLTTTADTLARTSGFVQRASKLTGAVFSQTLVFGFLDHPQASRDALAQTAALLGVAITPQGLDQRMDQAAAASYLQQLLGAATEQVLATDPAAIPILRRFAGVYVLDSTTVSLPASLAALWPGSGNQHSAAPTAALQLSAALDLASGALVGPDLSAGRSAERSTPLHQRVWPAHSLRLADLGFFDLGIFRALGEAQAYWLSRLRMGTVVWDQDGQRLDLLAWLRAAGEQVVDQWLRVGARERLRCRLIAVAVPQEVADQRRRRLQAEAKRHGRTLPAETLALAAWTIMITNVPARLLTPYEALILGRARWQIELLWKLWKSHGQIEQWCSAKPWAILCELYAKLIGMVIQHWIMLVGSWAYADRSLWKAARTVRQQAMCLATALGTGAGLQAALATLIRCMQRGCRINKGKKVLHTYQRLLDLTEAALG
jgi:Transposase DDE domain